MHLLMLFLFLAPKPDVNPCPIQITHTGMMWSHNAVNIKFKNTGEKQIKAIAFFIDMIDAVNDPHSYPAKLTYTGKLKPGKDANAWFPVYVVDFKAQSHNGIKAYPDKIVFDDGSDMVCK